VRDGLAYAELYATMALEPIRHMRGLGRHDRNDKLGDVAQ
jgi:hypothetical protein